MVRWIGLVGMVLVAASTIGCGATVKELPPKKDESGVQGDPRAKAMQGMPEEMRKKMEGKK